ncbi:MAG TPA: nuclease [Flavobacteriia bacterium]|nr:nuclease [Flavobacteriia bacterium]
MDTVKIFWDPAGVQLDYLGKKKISGTPADGDTPYIRTPIRMLGIDTPETNYPTIGSPANSDGRLTELANLLKTRNYNVDDGWIDFILPKLETTTAGTLQKQQGEDAKVFFKQLLDARLTKPNGTKRSLYIKSADEHFDSYGRLLAYIAPQYKKEELATMTVEQRATFNYDMIKSGWAAPILIYPNLPKNSDLRLARTACKNAVENKLGAWNDDNMLTGYEWRMCIKLHRAIKKLTGTKTYVRERDWVSRYCLDMTTQKVYYPQEYYKVQPYNRIFIWADDIREAVANLNLESE